MSRRIPALLGVFLAGTALVVAAVLARRPEPAPPPAKPREPSPPAIPSVPLRPPPADPLLRKWQAAVKARDRQGVTDAQAAFREREAEYRGPLERMAVEDADARVRAFTVTALAAFRSPPGEAFFIERLSDPSEFPRESALAALEKHGTAACLSAVEKAAASDPVEGLRAAAARVAERVRKK